LFGLLFGEAAFLGLAFVEAVDVDVAGDPLLIPTSFDDCRLLVHVRQIDATSPFQMANSGAHSVH